MNLVLCLEINLLPRIFGSKIKLKRIWPLAEGKNKSIPLSLILIKLGLIEKVEAFVIK